MENIRLDFQVLSIIFALLGSITSAKPCNNVNQTGSPYERCDVSTTSPADAEDDITTTGDDEEDSGLASHTVYTIVVIFGVVMIPIIVLTRICWLRKLQRQRCEVINEMRQIVDQRFSEEQTRNNGVFTLDLTNIPVEDILGKPPSYEESIANPCIGSPPPYDQPSGYKQNQYHINDNCTQYNGQNVDPLQHSNSNTSSDSVTEHEIHASTSSYDCAVVDDNETPSTSSNDDVVQNNETLSTIEQF